MTSSCRFVYILSAALLLTSNFLYGQSSEDSQDLAEFRRVIQEQRHHIARLQEQLDTMDRKLELMEAKSGQTTSAPVLAGNTAPVISERKDSAADGPKLLAATAAALFQQPLAPAPASVSTTPTVAAAPKQEAPKHWYEKYSIRGYTQIRTNRLLTDNSRLVCELCDKSIGNNNNFFIRRARVILSGDVNDHLSIYFQPDFASSSGNLHFGQLRDLYFDVFLDKKKEYRFRVGQSKVPFGFENMQSSQNRLALDRSDPINSGVPSERDMGAFFYWAPDKIRKRFAYLTASGLKGSGDYGVFAAGLYNGQTLNRPEANNNLHFVTRLSYPFEMKNKQIIEAGIQTYTGRYAVTADQRTATNNGPINFADRRTAASFVLYPQPFGLQAEYNFGTGPQFNPATLRTEQRRLRGGYVQAMYMYKRHGQVFTPFARYQYYDGGKKAETDARSFLVKSLEAGLEWQPNPFIEWTAEYVHGDRTFEDGRLPDNRQIGNILRLQLQLNY
ncbi:MAG: porin [Bryobacteraceae bacterium]